MLYARAGVPEYWAVNLNDNEIEMYSAITGGQYGSISKIKASESIVRQGASLSLAEIF